MKKDFSQPFELAEKINIGLLVEVPHHFPESRFVLSKVDLELPADEFLPLSFEVDAGKQVVREVAKFLYDKGLVLTSLRELVTEQSVEFTFVDNTPGVLDKEVYYYACADLAATQNDLQYVPFDEFQECIYSASLAEDIDIAAVNMLSTQR